MLPPMKTRHPLNHSCSGSPAGPGAAAHETRHPPDHSQPKRPSAARRLPPMKTNHPFNHSLHTRRRHACALSSFPALLLPALAFAGDLTIEVSGITPNAGRIYIAVYDRADSFPTPGRQRVSQVLDPTANHLTAHFKDLPPGQYAAVAFQDPNGNGKLDKNFLGIPKEPYGFSNGARGSAGPPKFSAAAVTLSPDATTQIELK